MNHYVQLHPFAGIITMLRCSVTALGPVLHTPRIVLDGERKNSIRNIMVAMKITVLELNGGGNFFKNFRTPIHYAIPEGMRDYIRGLVTL